MVEMVVVMCIITILATMAIPQMAVAVQRAKEGGAKGGLGALRAALHIRYADTERYPNDLSELVGPNLRSMPFAKGLVHHPDSDHVVTAMAPTDAGGWIYHNDVSDPAYGTVTINCTHVDRMGRVWADY